MRFHLGLGSKAKRLFLSSPAKEKAANKGNPVGEFGFKSKPVVDSRFGYSEFGSKDEIFFDSKAWLDSDCEDDFCSVNGDFTPSGGSTPKHHFSSTPGTPQVNKSLHLSTFPDSKAERSPTDGKKKLLDLLQETSQGEQVGDEQNAEVNGKANGYKLTNNQSSEESPYPSGTNSVRISEATPGRDFNYRKERIGRAKYCCFPG